MIPSKDTAAIKRADPATSRAYLPVFIFFQPGGFQQAAQFHGRASRWSRYPSPPHRQKIARVGGVWLDLLPQTADVDHQGVLVPYQRPLPKGGAKGVDGDDVPPGLPQLFQQGKFFGGEGNLPVAPADPALAPVDFCLPQPGGLGFLPVDPPQYRPQPEQQLLGQKGFGDIVVRPEAQPVEPGLVLVPGREEEHRQIPRLAQLAQKGKPVPVRQHYVQQYRIRGESAELFQGLAAGEGRRCRIARLGQDLAHHALEGGLVVHD